jgi:hypothetical protein
MSLNLKSIIQQLQPIFSSHSADAYCATPKLSGSKRGESSSKAVYSTTSRKTDSDKRKKKLLSNSTHKTKIADTNSRESEEQKNSKIRKSLFLTASKQQSSSSSAHDAADLTDSGLESSSKSIPFYKVDTHPHYPPFQLNKKCKLCLHQLSYSNEIRSKLLQAHVNYIKSNLSSEAFFANIPMLVVRSFRPSLNSTNKIQIRKGTAINALYMIDDKWVYVKTGSELKGFIPKKCCEPFAVNLLKCTHTRKPPKTHQHTAKSDNQNEHTYMSIDHLTKNNSRKPSDKKVVLSRNKKGNESIVKLLANSKSRNRKLSVAFNETKFNSNKITLTMLEGDRTSSSSVKYDQLATASSSLRNEQNVANSDYDFLTSPVSDLYYNQNLDETNEHEASCLDFLSSSGSSSITTISPLNANNKSEHHYDVLRTYNSLSVNRNAKKPSYLRSSDAYHLSKLNMYQIVSDYDAKYKQDLSVRKGDVVYLVKNEVNSSGQDKNNDDEWLFVRLYKRTQTTVSSSKKKQANVNNCEYQNLPTANLSDINEEAERRSTDYDAKLMQGFIPRSKAVKLFNVSSEADSNYYAIYN